MQSPRPASRSQSRSVRCAWCQMLQAGPGRELELPPLCPVQPRSGQGRPVGPGLCACEEMRPSGAEAQRVTFRPEPCWPSEHSLLRVSREPLCACGPESPVCLCVHTRACAAGPLHMPLHLGPLPGSPLCGSSLQSVQAVPPQGHPHWSPSCKGNTATAI